MKVATPKNLDLQKLVEDLKNQVKIKKDFVVPSAFFEMKEGELRIVDYNGESKELADLLRGTGISVPNDLMEVERRISLLPLPVCHQHISEKLGIPKKYYDRMMLAGNIRLLDANVSHWFKSGGEVNYLVRTFIEPDKGTGLARALLSDRFLPLDNYDVLITCLEAIQNAGIPSDFFQIEGEITEKHFYARFTAPSIEMQAPNLLKKYRTPDGSGEGNTGVVSGFVITNSEVGLGQFSISPRVIILRCKNGLTFAEDSFSKKHLGSEMSEFSEIKWSDDTKRKNQELIIGQVQDCVKSYLSPEYLGTKIKKLERLASEELNHPYDAVKNVCSSLNISEGKQNNILDYFLRGADTTSFGVVQALTYYAHKDADADERYELEAMSVSIMDTIIDYDKPFIKGEQPRYK